MADALPFGVGGPAEDQADPSPVLGSLAMGVLNIPKHLIDSAAQFDPNDIHGSTARVAPAAAQTAMALMGSGAPAAEAGAAGIFGGKLARTADIDKLIYANKMRGNGESPTSILNETGWFRPPTDNKWRFEIPDTNARMMGHGLNYADDGSSMTGPARLMMQHPELYKAYPQLAERQMQNSVLHDPGNGVGTGAYWPDNGFIEVAAPDLGKAKSVGLHELQHGVQGIENFAPGGNPDVIRGLQTQEPSKIPLPLQGQDPYALYHNLAGEVEARNVQSRSNIDNLIREKYPTHDGLARHSTPWQTQDVPYNQQLIRNPQTELIRMLRNK